jgi:hypothetical protein
MSPLTYLLLNLAYLVAGFVLGRLTRTVEQKIITDAVPKGAAVARNRPRIRLRFEHYVAIFLVVLGIFTAVQSLQQARQNRASVQCIRDYADFFADALDARSETSAAATNALDELMATVGRLTTGGQAGTPAVRDQFQDALADYFSKRTQAKEQQQRNPYPPPPRNLCQ